MQQLGGAVATIVISQQEDSGFKPVSRVQPFCVEFACFSHTCAFRESG